MASFSRETRSAVRTHHRRDSSSHNSSRHRPRLLRSTATEPSITPSNAIRGPLASSNSPQKATDLLNRVAIYSPPSTHLEHTSTVESISHHQSEPIMICGAGSENSPTSCQDVVLVDSPSGYYFSFPSFDDWSREKQHLDKDTDD